MQALKDSFGHKWQLLRTKDEFGSRLWGLLFLTVMFIVILGVPLGFYAAVALAIIFAALWLTEMPEAVVIGIMVYREEYDD